MDQDERYFTADEVRRWLMRAWVACGLAIPVLTVLAVWVARGALSHWWAMPHDARTEAVLLAYGVVSSAACLVIVRWRRGREQLLNRPSTARPVSRSVRLRNQVLVPYVLCVGLVAVVTMFEAVFYLGGATGRLGLAVLLLCVAVALFMGTAIPALVDDYEDSLREEEERTGQQ